MIKNNNKNIIIGVCAATLAVAIIIAAIVFSAKNNIHIDDAYFVSDGTKYVLTLDNEMMGVENSNYTPIKTHIVYKYFGDKITNMVSYLEFADESSAKSNLPTYREIYDNSEESDIKNISVNGKYIVIEAAEDQYSDLSASEVKQNIELMKLSESDSSATDNE